VAQIVEAVIKAMVEMLKLCEAAIFKVASQPSSLRRRCSGGGGISDDAFSFEKLIDVAGRKFRAAATAWDRGSKSPQVSLHEISVCS